MKRGAEEEEEEQREDDEDNIYKDAAVFDDSLEISNEKNNSGQEGGIGGATKPLINNSNTQKLLINFENIKNEDLEKIPFNLEFGDGVISAAGYFLRDFRTKVTIKEKHKFKNKTVNYYRDLIRLLPTRKFKLIDIDYYHFSDWVSLYYEKMEQICVKYGFVYPMIDLMKVRHNQSDMTDICIYIYSKKLLEYLDKDRVDEWQKTMRDGALLVYRQNFDYDFSADVRNTKNLVETRDFLLLHIGIKNFPIERNIQDIKSEHLKTACVIRGDLVSFDQRARQEVVKSWWSCNNCQFTFPVKGEIKPYKCTGCGERSTFEQTGQLDIRDYVYLKVQQHMSESESQISATDITVRLEGKYLIENFYQFFQTSLSVKITGIVELSSEKINQKNLNERLLMMHCLTIESEGENSTIQYNDRLMDVIATRVNPSYQDKHFDKLIRSFCPHLYGLDPIKLAMLLLCVGAEPRINASTKQRIRGDLVILLVGDPGTGKSEFGLFLLKVVPGSIRTIGGKKTTTAAALTSAIDQNNGIPVVVKGVLPRCDKRGIAIIDELDKREPDDFEVLSIPLDDNQVIPTHKRGIHSNLMARCPVLMLGNASKNQGKWDPTKTIYEQTKYANWLLSRADLIFVMLDEGDMKQKDAMVQHIARSRAGSVIEGDYDAHYKNKTYSDLLIEKVESDLINDKYDGIYDTEYLRHEIYYLKKTYKPMLKSVLKPSKEDPKKLEETNPAILLLNKEYLRLSQLTLINEYTENENIGKIQQTLLDARSYNALERLAMAVARCRRHHEVRVEDMQKAIDLMVVSRTSLMPRQKQDPDKLDSTNAYNNFAKILKEKGEFAKQVSQNEIYWRRQYDMKKRAYVKKMEIFNKYLNSIAYEKCKDCRGNGFIAVDMQKAETCMNCKGRKQWPVKFSKFDLEANMLSNRAMTNDEVKFWINKYIDRKIILEITRNVFKIAFDEVDPVSLGDFIDEVAAYYAEADITRDRAKAEGGMDGEGPGGSVYFKKANTIE